MSTKKIRSALVSVYHKDGLEPIVRKLAGQSEFTLVGNTGEKFITDSSLLQGTTGATYIIQGFRGALAGEASDQIGVQFGVGMGGGMAVTNAELKMAA